MKPNDLTPGKKYFYLSSPLMGMEIIFERKNNNKYIFKVIMPKKVELTEEQIMTEVFEND